MALTLLAFALPSALFLVLALLPVGRTLLLSALVTIAVLIGLWLAHYLDVLGLEARGAHKAQVMVFFLLMGLSLAWFMAVSLQVLRRRFPAHWPAWSWPMVVLVTLAAIGFGIFRMVTL